MSANHSGNPAELVRRIMSGDAAAEAELVQRYQRGVSVIIRQIIKCPSTAEDCSQDSFRIIIERVRGGAVREPERLSGFVRGVAKNTAIASVRRARTGNPAGLEDAEHVRDPAPNQLDVMLVEETALIVRQVIAEIKWERYREVLRRYFVTGQDKEEICRDLNLSSVEFNHLISRAIARFKGLYVRRARRDRK